MQLTPTLLIAALLSGSAIAAQEKKPEGQKPPPQKEATPKEASATAEPAIVLSFNVSGLSKENEAKVKETLTALTAPRYVCEPCKVDEAAAGECPKCDAPLALKQRPLLQGAVPQTDQGKLSLTVAPGNAVAYSQLESVLAKNSVQIDEAKFPITGKSQLIVRGGTSENAAAIQKALQDAKLFDEVKATFDPASSEIRVSVRAGATPPTRAKVETAIEGSAAGVKLGDVVFGPPPKA